MQRIEVRRINTKTTRITSNQLSLRMAEKRIWKWDRRETRGFLTQSYPSIDFCITSSLCFRWGKRFDGRARLDPLNVNFPCLENWTKKMLTCHYTKRKRSVLVLVVLGWATSCWMLRFGTFRICFPLAVPTTVDEQVKPRERKRSQKFIKNRSVKIVDQRTSKFDGLCVDNDVGEFFGDQHSWNLCHNRRCFVRFQDMISINGTATLQSLPWFRIQDAVSTLLIDAPRRNAWRIIADTRVV